jgi:ligand-binding sensor domain-containing protein
MKRKFLYFVFLAFIQVGFAQSNALWQSYFSYNEIKAISDSPTAVIVASENALFSKNISTNILKTTTTIDGLSGQTISSLYYSSVFNKTLVGYENGLILVINETDGKVTKVVDIINKQLASKLKKINHFMEHGGIAYVSCDFGIVQFNLTTLLFGDTYFIGDIGLEVSVRQTTIYNGFIYAATANGIRKADITNKNLVDYNQWTKVANSNWLAISTFDTQLFAIDGTGFIKKYDANTNSFVGVLNLPQAPTDMRSKGDYLLVTTPNSVFVYNKQMVLVSQFNKNQVLDSTVSFSCATLIGDNLYIGTQENGIFTTSLTNTTVFENTSPTGPSRNNVFAINGSTNNLWVVYGGYTGYNPFTYPGFKSDNYGISKYNKSFGWSHIPYKKVFGATALCRITINPNNENQVFISSYYSGLLKLENDVPTFLYDAKNTAPNGLKSILNQPSDDVRINGAVFDKTGNLWLNNSLIDDGFKVLKSNGQWQSYPMNVILDRPVGTDMARMIIDKNGTKWWGTNINGLIGYNESINKFKKITLGPDSGNLPTANVVSVALDNKNQLWIGTKKGLRVLSNTNSFLTDNQLTTSSIIINDNNLGQELFYDQFITDIVVDGANNKWIGTADSGIFLVSPNGQETKYHFTIDNSPLPSNLVNDIDINAVTGEVFIATSKGLISFKGNATKAKDDLNNAYVFPNPVRPEYEGTVKIAGLTDKANVKITDVTGNLVYEAISEGGTIEWDTTAFGKYKVASGVYMVFISDQEGVETNVKKVMIIR